MKKISGRRKFRRQVKSAGTGGSVQGHTAFGVGLCSKAKERISGPSRASERNAGPVGAHILSLRGVRPRSNPEVRDCHAPLAMTTRQWIDWRNERGEDLGPLAGGEDEKGQSS